jgi:hypothetical protein
MIPNLNLNLPSNKNSMKYITGLFVVFGMVSISYSQDSTKTIRANVPGAASRPGVAMSYVSLDRAKELTHETSSIAGTYTIDHYSVQLRKPNNNKIINTVGTEAIVTDISIGGEAMDSILFQISDRELMSTDDYLYRVFGELPEEIPTDLPVTLYVYKTNNLECYGIGQLSDRTLLIPVEGILLYLKPSSN